MERVQRANPKQARELLVDNGFDARNNVFITAETPPRLSTCTGDEVWMPRHQANYVRIEAQMQCRGMVILTDTWFPGWARTVDGKRAKIERAYGNRSGRGCRARQSHHRNAVSTAKCVSRRLSQPARGRTRYLRRAQKIVKTILLRTAIFAIVAVLAWIYGTRPFSQLFDARVHRESRIVADPAHQLQPRPA